jgi:hypothetical protein
VISALLGLPVFFTANAANWARISVAVLMVGTALAVTMPALAAQTCCRQPAQVPKPPTLGRLQRRTDRVRPSR